MTSYRDRRPPRFRSRRSLIAILNFRFRLLAALLIGLSPAYAQTALSSSNKNAFPNARTTGPQPGVTLKLSNSLVIRQPRAVIDGLDVMGTVIIEAPHVTLRNCKVTSASDTVVLIRKNVIGARIENCEIDNRGYGGSCIAGQGTFIRNNIHDCADGIDVRGDDTSIADNYIHRLRGTTHSHFDGIQADGDFSNLAIVHNTIINDQNQTSAIMIDNYWGPIDRVVIKDNLLAGGGYTVYINEIAKGQRPGGPVTNVSLISNSIRPGFWGPLTLRMELGNRPIVSANTNVSTATIRQIVRDQ